ncbi:microfibril-associated glycoprotein 4-like [Musca autumnalis]|uniref:microfibril-associated glycoprotein 4-like n=1 Tax=Musca autumnalis TaxID=221902 RepID=UPI003CF6C0EF
MSVKDLRQNTKKSGEIVIQRRIDGSEDFFSPRSDYKHGFGNSSGEFFIGLDKLNKLTNSRPYDLLIHMEDWKMIAAMPDMINFNLNGSYVKGTTKQYAKGVDWDPFKGHYYSLKFVEMILRPT